MNGFTREQLEDMAPVSGIYAFALALLDQNEADQRELIERGKDIHTLTCALESERLRAEKAEELAEDKDRTLAQAIKSHLREVDKRKQAETISAGNLARAEKAEAERDEANDERDDAVDRWSRRAREAEAACKELLQVQADRDRLEDLLRRINGLDEKADAASWQQQAEDRETLALQIAADRDRLREELREAEEAIRLIERITVTYDDARADGDAESVARVGQAFLDHPAVRRARERAK